MKRLFICFSLLIILCLVVGCTENIVSTVPMSDSSTPLTQSTKNASTASQTQSTKSASTTLQNQSTTDSPPQSKMLNNSGDNKVYNNCRLIVKGKDITSGNYVKLNHEVRYAELPLTAVLKELGAKVEWQSKTTAKITIGVKEYTLDTSKASLIEKGSNFNILVVAPGSKHGKYYKIVGDEFVIDSDSVKLLIINMMGAKIRIDYDKKIVEII